MVKPKQIGKSHNYPSQRKSYQTSRIGVGGRKKKKIEGSSGSSTPTYFDLLRRKQTEKKGADRLSDKDKENGSDSVELEVSGSSTNNEGIRNEDANANDLDNLEQELEVSESSTNNEETENSDIDIDGDVECDLQSVVDELNVEESSSNEESDVEDPTDTDLSSDEEDGIDNSEGVDNPDVDYRSFRLAKYVSDYPWLYYNVVSQGYKCKTCEMFPPLVLTGGKSKLKFGMEAVTSLTDHPRRFLNGHQTSSKHVTATKQYEDYKLQHTFESLEDKNARKAVRESEVTEEALVKLLKITVFMVKKHWAHTYNYEDFVRFIGTNLKDKVLEEYLQISESHKNATYLSPNTVIQFVKVVSDWIKDETTKELKNCKQFTLLLDESTDESNRSELSLIARIVKDGRIENLFLNLLQLRRCDAATIFNTVHNFLNQEEIDITRTRFAGMDGCSTMSGEHSGVKTHFEKTSPHLVYIHCRNHRLALCFAHLIPRYEAFEKFDGLLLNLYLLLKHSSVRASIFEEVQRAYDLPSLKLIKAAVTRWLSHGKAAQRVLDRYEVLVASLDEMYLRKKEPAIRGLRDDLVKPNIIATICFLADILASTNNLQTFLQGSRLNFLQLPKEVDNLINILNEKAENPMHPPDSYFARLPEYIDIASRSAGARYLGRSYKEFDTDAYVDSVVKPFIEDLVGEIERAFEIPDHLKGFTILDPQSIPRSATDLEGFGEESLNSLAGFYGTPSITPTDTYPSIINGDALLHQYKAFKVYVLKHRLEWENTKRKSLVAAQQRLAGYEIHLDTMGDLLSKRKKILCQNKIKTANKEIEELQKSEKYTFDVMLLAWMKSSAAVRHPEMTTILELASLIPPSTAEVERSFSLMKLISTRLRSRLSQESLGHCMRICRFGRKLEDTDYDQILQRWLKADNTKSKKRKVASRIGGAHA